MLSHFVRPASEHLDTMLEVFSGRVCSGPRRAAAGIFAVTPFSLAMCCFETSLDILDSHAHRPYGALLASGGFETCAVVFGIFFCQVLSNSLL